MGGVGWRRDKHELTLNTTLLLRRNTTVQILTINIPAMYAAMDEANIFFSELLTQIHIWFIFYYLMSVVGCDIPVSFPPPPCQRTRSYLFLPNPLPLPHACFSET